MRINLIAGVGSILVLSSAALGGAATLNHVGEGSRPDISDDGRYVSFSTGKQLVPTDTCFEAADTYVLDRQTGTYTQVSVSSDGAQGTVRDTTDGRHSAISADGRHVAFESVFTNLVPNDTNGVVDLFVHDLDTARTTRVSVGPDGVQANGPSESHYHRPGISADGRFVAFTSIASNLVADDTNDNWDVFVHDRDADGNGVFDEPGGIATERVSVGSNGEQGDSTSGGGAGANITADGRYVAFVSSARTLMPDTNGHTADAYVYDRVTRTLARVSNSSTGAQGNRNVYDVAISDDGRVVAFASHAGNLVPEIDDDDTLDVFVHEPDTGVTKRISVSSWYSDGPTLSSDGRFVAYYSFQAYTRVHKWVFDRVTGTTVQVDVDPAGKGNHLNSSRAVTIAGGGRHVVFQTRAELLPVGILNYAVFVHGCALFQSPGEPDPTICAPDSHPLGAIDQARFANGLAEFAELESIAEGLGPVFNEASCATCHNRPYVGGSGTRTVTRFGTGGPGGFDPLAALGGLVLQSQGIDTGSCAVAGEVVPPEATVVSERDTPPLFGMGLVELVPDDKILRLADPTDKNGDGITGRPNMVGGRVGRFGRKAQLATLRAFAGDAYLNEMGVTSPDFPVEVSPQGGAPVCDPVADPEDDGTDVTAFTDFLTFLAPLPAARYASNDVKREARKGFGVFKRLGCRSCHTDKLRTGASLVPAMSNRKVPMFSDLLLHDLGPGLADGIEEGQASGSEFRTAPLWGAAWSAPYLHDGRAATLEDAIVAHGGEAAASRNGFLALPDLDRSVLLTFLGTL